MDQWMDGMSECAHMNAKRQQRKDMAWHGMVWHGIAWYRMVSHGV